MSTTTELGVPEIIIDANEVTICGVRVPRPESLAPSQWQAFWERAKDVTYVQRSWGHRREAR